MPEDNQFCWASFWFVKRMVYQKLWSTFSTQGFIFHHIPHEQWPENARFSDMAMAQKQYPPKKKWDCPILTLTSIVGPGRYLIFFLTKATHIQNHVPMHVH